VSSLSAMDLSIKNSSRHAPVSIYDSLQIPPASNCIRLFSVLTPSDSEDNGGPIRGDLCVVDLDNCQPFLALSYVWGQVAAVPHTVQCGAFSVNVTPNCHSALWHLRKKLGAFTIWIDSICINQQDKKDKEHQIPLMGQIYSGAHTVYVWLGEGNTATDKVITYLSTAGFVEGYFLSDDADGELDPPRSLAALGAMRRARWNFKDVQYPYWRNSKCRPRSVPKLISLPY